MYWDRSSLTAHNGNHAQQDSEASHGRTVRLSRLSRPQASNHLAHVTYRGIAWLNVYLFCPRPYTHPPIQLRPTILPVTGSRSIS